MSLEVHRYVWWWFLFFLVFVFTTILACTTPTNLSSSSIITPSSATISWDAVTGAQYYIYGTRIIGATGWVYDTTTSTSVSLTGLSSYPNVELRYRVKVVCDVSGTNFSVIVVQRIYYSRLWVILQLQLLMLLQIWCSDGSASIRCEWWLWCCYFSLNTSDTTALSAGTYTVTATDAVGWWSKISDI